MAFTQDLNYGLNFLYERELFRYNEVWVVRNIPAGEVRPAFAWLLWSACDIQVVEGLQPISFDAAFISRVSNVNDVLTMVDDIPNKEEFRTTWDEASLVVERLDAPRIDMARISIAEFLKESA